MAGLERAVVLVNTLVVHGRTRLQKYGYLASQLQHGDLERLDFYQDWEPHRYGPYSRTLDHDVRQCIKDGILDVSSEAASDGNACYVYALTPKGHAMLRNLALEYGPLIEALHAMPKNFDKKLRRSLAEDVCEAHLKYATNSLIKGGAVGAGDGADGDYDYELNLNPEIERAIDDIESGRSESKAYTIDEYIKHVEEVLEERSPGTCAPSPQSTEK